MRLLTQAHEFEYRDGTGVDRLGQADLWSSSGGDRAVLVLRGVQDAPVEPEPPTLQDDASLQGTSPHDASPYDDSLQDPPGLSDTTDLRENGRRALRELEASLLPFLVPRARLNVLVLHRRHRAGKYRALVLS